jgi:hypothetical protein
VSRGGCRVGVNSIFRFFISFGVGVGFGSVVGWWFGVVGLEGRYGCICGDGSPGCWESRCCVEVVECCWMLIAGGSTG